MAQRNGTYALAMATKGHINDVAVPSWVASEEAEQFIRECFKMDITDVVRKFELWAVCRKRGKQDIILNVLSVF